MTKRWIDIVVGTVLAVALTPLMFLLAIGSALSLKTWPFFAQTRVGLGGREFRIVKIRTMPRTAPAYADKYAIAASVHIPRFCQFMRNHHIDELPQLWLVPVGRMSLVGPRPEMRMLHDTFDPEFAALRTSVRPGCSGLWQIGHGAVGLIVESPEYDRLYIANAGVRLDAWVLWQTALMLTGIGHSRPIGAVPEWTRRRVAEPTAATVIRLRDYETEAESALALDA